MDLDHIKLSETQRASTDGVELTPLEYQGCGTAATGLGCQRGWNDWRGHADNQHNQHVSAI